MHITTENQTILALIEFSIRGELRFLSHAETVRLFQRACGRAGIRLQYSRGYNPRPKLSLPVPRSVGIETEGDFLCLRVSPLRPPESQLSPEPGVDVDTQCLRAELAAQLPDGCELISVALLKAQPSFLPAEAAYELVLIPKHLDYKLKNRIERILTSESITLRRRIDAKGSVRNVNVRRFLKSIRTEDERIEVVCRISSAGSIRVDEILEILELGYDMLAAPISRRSLLLAGA